MRNGTRSVTKLSTRHSVRRVAVTGVVRQRQRWRWPSLGRCLKEGGAIVTGTTGPGTTETGTTVKGVIVTGTTVTDSTVTDSTVTGTTVTGTTVTVSTQTVAASSGLT